MPRKTRSDRGAVKITARDMAVMRFVCEMDEVSIPHLQVLLTKETHNPQQPTVSHSRVLQLIDRWKRYGWVEYRNPYRDPKKPGSIYATRKCLKDFGYDFSYRVRDLGALPHVFAINHVRLWLDDWMRKNRYMMEWKSERELRRDASGKFPDAIVYYGKAVVAVEVEASRKAKSTYEEINGYYAKTDFNAVWYFHDGLDLVLSEMLTDSKFKFRPLSGLVLPNGYTLFQKAEV